MSVVLSISLTACGTPTHRETHPSTTQIDEDVLNNVSEFAINVGNPAEEAWKRLSAYRREDLLASLLRLRDANRKDDILEAYIAFVLCNLDYDYEGNRSVIVNAFKQSIDYADRLRGPVARLIDRGDWDLLPLLFDVALRSDGDLSEGLASTFSNQMQARPEQFLLRLKAQPSAVKHRVYELLRFGMPKDGSQITAYLSTVPKDSPIATVAKEMLTAISK